MKKKSSYTKTYSYKKRMEMTKENALKLLQTYYGNISLTCEKLGVTRQTFYKWRSEDREFDRAVEEINERTLDFVESKLLDGINEGNARLIMFYLNCKGKKRGYGLKNESDNDKSNGIVINITQEEADF